jgi:hypothetical protein
MITTLGRLCCENNWGHVYFRPLPQTQLNFQITQIT